jgi:integrating conjugative element membrane protein (TIGR03747 family)
MESSTVDRQRYHGLLWSFLWWAAIVMLATLAVDCLYVMWPYPHGAIGLDAFQADVRTEWSRLLRLSGECFPRIAYVIHDDLYAVLFKWPGFDYMIARAGDPTPLGGGGEMMRRAVLATNTFWGTAVVGLQLFSARLAVLAISIPLFALTTIGAAGDGLVTWYLRRTGGARESGFIFHRAKRHAGHALLVLCFVYLVPPSTIDPRIIISVSVALFAIAIRVAVANFKKYL